MSEITAEELSTIARAIFVGASPAGVAIDVADLAVAAYNLYKDKNDDNYFEVILCVIGFIPGAGDGVKTGFRIVNRRPEILFSLIRYVMTECKIYGDPEKWLEELISETKIKTLLQKGKQEALNASNKNIDSDWAKSWINQSIEFTFSFLDSMLANLIQLLARKVLHWKTKVPKSSAQRNIHHSESTHKKQKHNNANKTTYPKSNSGENGKKDGNRSKVLSKADITATLKGLNYGSVGEHMADYWVAKELNETPKHDDGAKPSRKILQPMTQLKIGANEQGIDAIWKSDKKNIGIMNTKTYAIIEAKASLNMGKGVGPGSLLNDLDKQQDTRNRHAERAAAKKEKRAERKLKPKKKIILNQQMSKEWVNKRLDENKTISVRTLGYSRHLLYFNYAHPDTVDHLNALALSISDGFKIDQSKHANTHTPSNFWGQAKIDDALKSRVEKANKKNGY